MTTYENKRQQTKDKIINSTIKLGKQFGLANITISSIIKEAKINRSTFYRYFIDKQELVDFIQTNILNQIKTEFAKYEILMNKANGQDNLRIQFLESFLSVLDNYHEEIKFLISTKGSPSFNYALANLFVDLSGQRLLAIFGAVSNKNRPLYSYYFGSSIIGIIKYWIDYYNEYSKEDIINFIVDLNQRITVNK
ncbi:TetR/AcrR family transcriptional regulator [Lactobacillaceae bacterium Scapto_B20]